MRTSLLILAALSSVSTLGCQTGAAAPMTPERSSYFSTPSGAKGTELQTLRVEAPGSAVAALHQWLGDTNTVTLAKPLKVAQSGLTIVVPAGASVNYTLTPDHGVFTFAEPRPTISARVFGFSVSPKLERLELNADNRGTATAALGLVRQTREFTLAWAAPAAGTDPPAVIAEPPARPVVYAWSTANCGPCAAAKAALKAAANLPFDVIWDPKDKPAPTTQFPCFSWKTSTGATHVEVGWANLATFLSKWQKSAGTDDRRASTGGVDLHRAAQFTTAWYESDGRGQLRNTSLEHLIRDHGVDPAALKPYAARPELLNNIHGWLHTHTTE